MCLARQVCSPASRPALTQLLVSTQTLLLSTAVPGIQAWEALRTILVGSDFNTNLVEIHLQWLGVSMSGPVSCSEPVALLS